MSVASVLTEESAGLLPLIADESGYRLTRDDLSFLELTSESAWWLGQRDAPFGITPAEFTAMLSDLVWALGKHSVADCDVRLQGSAAHGFSSLHKPMPADRTDVARLLAESRKQAPTALEVDTATTALDRQWPVGQRPGQRPFNALYRLGIDEQSSDYDFQLSSDSMISQVTRDLARLGVDPSRMKVNNPHYAFVEKRYAERSFATIRDWSLDYTTSLKRPVNWVLFDRHGPKRKKKKTALSSHFKPSDWVLLSPSQTSSQRLAPGNGRSDD